jgi:D-alanine--D-alanine ligase
LEIILICGGCSDERNISLNSARSVYENIEDFFNVKVIYLDRNLNKYLINSEFLYSNTTSDFDFKINKENQKLNDEEHLKILKNSDLVFPVMHGRFAEDGQIQRFFEDNDIRFIGSPSFACKKMYNKFSAEKEILQKRKMFDINKTFLHQSESVLELKKKIKIFFEKNGETIIKPIEGGSSFGVKHATTLRQLQEFSFEMLAFEDRDILLEERCHGREFTVIILQGKNGTPTALIPTEIEVKDGKNIIFDTRRKYLATNETHYHCPARFGDEIIKRIQEEAESLFEFCGAMDFLRIDGWLIGDNIYFSDFNPISGMEQNSFIFQQGSKIGMTHGEMLKYIIGSAAMRYGIEFKGKETKNTNDSKKTVNVLFGGITSERQVSILSGSNVWLKLLRSGDYLPKPYLLYNGQSGYMVLCLPYSMVLYHTVEEILWQFKNPPSDYSALVDNIRSKLLLPQKKMEIPKDFSLEEFLINSKNKGEYVLLALHGGVGEDGTLQKKLEKLGIPFNGCSSRVSKICMDKYETGKIVNSLDISKLRSAKKILFDIKNIPEWNEIATEIGSEFIVKPNNDGCSTGVVVLHNKKEFDFYINIVKSGAEHVPENSFEFNKKSIMLGKCEKYIVEEFIKTDKIFIANEDIIIENKTGWRELTVGVLEKNQKFHSLSPSITIVESGEILSVEEKFQGGTGINITPPPKEIINCRLLKEIKKCAEVLCEKIGVKDYCRIDLFANDKTDEIIIIEINTLPALTPSTVLLQQITKENLNLFTHLFSAFTDAN